MCTHRKTMERKARAEGSVATATNMKSEPLLAWFVLESWRLWGRETQTGTVLRSSSQVVPQSPNATSILHLATGLQMQIINIPHPPRHSVADDFG
jgi:hypothetical protein